MSEFFPYCSHLIDLKCVLIYDLKSDSNFPLCNIWLHVRESRKILEPGFHVTDSGFQELDSDSVSVELGFRVSIAFGSPDSKAQDSRTLETGLPSIGET